jgi:hypothetical protein
MVAREDVFRESPYTQHLRHTRIMPKIYLAHPKDGDSESSELKALGLKFNKAEPSRIGLLGLRTLEQPGYESYMHHIAGFMFANDTKEKQKLQHVGFPIKFKLANCFPLLQPPLHIKSKATDAEKIRSIFVDRRMDSKETKQKTGKDDFTIFTVIDAFPAFNSLRSIGLMRSHAPSGQVSFNGYLAYLLALRIFSSFYCTHTYPAYSTPTEEEDYEGLKRRIIEEQGPRKEARVEGGGVTTDADADTAMDVPDSDVVDKVTLRYAKPSDSTVRPWGNSVNDTPTTHGIVFPFVPQLANWDKEMVPLVMERYFLRCFGSNDQAISTAFAGFVESWKAEVYSTHAGIVMSHMAKIIAIAFPAQARPFPLFEGGQYRGCYLSGANFSVAIKASLTRPTSYDENLNDLRSMFGREAFIAWIRQELVPNDSLDGFDHIEWTSLRQLHDWILNEASVNAEDVIKARARAANAIFPQTYLPATVTNIQFAILSALSLENTPDTPMHYEGFLSLDPFEVNLSAFGPGVPSPHIPGGKEMSSFRVVPPNSTACFRRCQLRSAVTEWKDVIEKRTVRNEPKNLNAKYQFVRISGVEEKTKWYAMMDTVIEKGKSANTVVPKHGSESNARKGDMDNAVDELFDM